MRAAHKPVATRIANATMYAASARGISGVLRVLSLEPILCLLPFSDDGAFHRSAGLSSRRDHAVLRFQAPRIELRPPRHTWITAAAKTRMRE